jgi:hypothetical protein
MLYNAQDVFTIQLCMLNYEFLIFMFFQESGGWGNKIISQKYKNMYAVINYPDLKHTIIIIIYEI